MFSHLIPKKNQRAVGFGNFFVFSRVEHVHDEGVQISTRNTMAFFHDMTFQTRIAWSVKPANNVCPSADQAMETHSGCLASSRTSV